MDTQSSSGRRINSNIPERVTDELEIEDKLEEEEEEDKIQYRLEDDIGKKNSL